MSEAADFRRENDLRAAQAQGEQLRQLSDEQYAELHGPREPSHRERLAEEALKRGAEIRHKHEMLGYPMYPGFPEAVVSLIACEHPAPFTKDERKAIEKLEAELLKIREGIEKSTPTAAKDYFLKQRSEQVKHAVKGDVDKPEHFFSVEELKEEFKARMSLLKQERREREAEVNKIFAEILNRCSPHVAELSKRVEDSEKAECSRFAYPFHPSPLALSLRSLAYRLGSFQNGGLSWPTVLKAVFEAWK